MYTVVYSTYSYIAIYKGNNNLYCSVYHRDNQQQYSLGSPLRVKQSGHASFYYIVDTIFSTAINNTPVLFLIWPNSH